MTATATIEEYCLATANAAKKAAPTLLKITSQAKNAWLRKCAAAIVDSTDEIVAANQRDLARSSEFKMTEAQIDRLRLDKIRLESITNGLLEIASLPDPVGEIIEGEQRPNGLELRKIRVPLGVVFFIYESRPNVTADAAALCIKSGNSVILRGGKEAANSSRALLDVIQRNAPEFGIPATAMQLVGTEDRTAIDHFLNCNSLIDVAIPRGGRGLIERVSANARMPVIKHLDGNCHVYVDASAENKMATSIVENSKCHRYGVCNAAESLVAHRDARNVAKNICEALLHRGIEIRGCPEFQSLHTAIKPATEVDWGTEYLGPTISAIFVDSIDDAITHINRYSSGHTDSIVTNDLSAARRFTTEIDSSAVMVNCSTRFNDGGEFGKGAEIGISTDKFHARGPCGLKELTSYKYIVEGSGQIRS